MKIQGYNFEQFTSFKSKFSSKISVGKTGFGFSSGFYDKNSLKGSIGLKLFYDKDRRAVAFKFLDSMEDGMVKLKKRQTGGYVSAVSFFGKYEINPEKYSGRYDPIKIEDDKLGTIFIIELKQKEDSNKEDNQNN